MGLDGYSLDFAIMGLTVHQTAYQTNLSFIITEKRGDQIGIYVLASRSTPSISTALYGVG